MSHTVRVWDLPIRIFHWALVVCIAGLLITGTVGGNIMVWHFRFGYAVMSLLLFRIVWGIVGGRWGRFASFIYSPASVMAYLKGRGDPAHTTGHSPIGAGSVFAMLLILGAQVASGLMSDDEIAFAGPLTRFVSGATVSLATNYHKNYGRWILIALVVLHVAAILFYLWRRNHNLIKPMIVGDKQLVTHMPSSRDDAVSRFAAAIVFAACAAGVGWMVSLG